jgi:hypothetical protein
MCLDIPLALAIVKDQPGVFLMAGLFSNKLTIF